MLYIAVATTVPTPTTTRSASVRSRRLVSFSLKHLLSRVDLMCRSSRPGQVCHRSGRRPLHGLRHLGPRLLALRLPAALEPRRRPSQRAHLGVGLSPAPPHTPCGSSLGLFFFSIINTIIIIHRILQDTTHFRPRHQRALIAALFIAFNISLSLALPISSRSRPPPPGASPSHTSSPCVQRAGRRSPRRKRCFVYVAAVVVVVLHAISRRRTHAGMVPARHCMPWAASSAVGGGRRCLLFFLFILFMTMCMSMPPGPGLGVPMFILSISAVAIRHSMERSNRSTITTGHRDARHALELPLLHM